MKSQLNDEPIPGCESVPQATLVIATENRHQQCLQATLDVDIMKEMEAGGDTLDRSSPWQQERPTAARADFNSQYASSRNAMDK